MFFRGQWHLFYQHNPQGTTWGHMSWGHATSRDLVRWQHLPVAIEEADGIMIFSGSAVVDHDNSSGLCRPRPTTTRDRSCLIAIYTGHGHNKQTQNLAVSQDGITFTKYAGNPVLDIAKKDFRDPKVFWHAPSSGWVMVAAWAQHKQIRIYRSADLIHWSHASDFGPAGATDGIWECPDLFPLPLDGDKARQKWVMVVNLNPGGPAGGSGGQYFVGDFDGLHFRDTNPPNTTLWIDHGKDAYATVSWSDVPATDGRRIWLSWMSNWQYTNQEPTTAFRGAMTVPKVLSLRTTPDGPRVFQQPVPELRRLRGPVRRLARTRLDGDLPVPSLAGPAVEIVAVIESATATQVGLRLRHSTDEETVVGYDVTTAQLFVDRTRAGNVTFHKAFPGRHTAPLSLTNGRLRLHVLLDASSVEVFADDGRVVITDRIFPSPTALATSVFATGGAASLVSFEAWKLRAP